MQIDRSLIKLLASDTRSDIIRALRARRKTMTELADELRLAPATVSEQLDKLEAGGLVRKADEGRKWKYYELTKQSRELTKPEPQPVLLVIGSLLVLLFIGAYFQAPQQAASAGGEQALRMDAKTTGDALTMAVQPENEGGDTIGVATGALPRNESNETNSTNSTFTD